MSRNFENLLQDIFKKLDIHYKISVDRVYYFHGNPNVCASVKVMQKEEIEYCEYFCYSIKGREKIVFVEGNTIFPFEKGILSYLGLNDEIKKFFKDKLEEKVLEHAKRHY